MSSLQRPKKRCSMILKSYILEGGLVLRTILCSTGTSIARGCSSLEDFQKNGSDWDDDTKQLESEILQRMQQYDLGTEKDRVIASAELNSLHRLGLQEDDEVVLLVTDTADGRACAGINARYIESIWPGTTATIKRIEGLQVRDENLLRSKGLLKLLEVSLHYVNDLQRKYANGLGDGIIINPTAGFKGVVPFLVLLGMIFRVPTYYLFEFSNTIIRLPPLPFSFDIQIFRRARRALSLVRAEGAIPEAQFFKLIIGFQEHERPLFESLVEKDGEFVTISPLAFVMSEVEDEGSKPVWLSPQVVEQLNKRQGTDRKRLEEFLVRLSNPLWRASQPHSFSKCELPVFGNSRYMFRAAAFMQADKLYVCRAYHDHDKYETELNNFKKKDVPPLNKFVEWTPSMTEEELDEAEENELATLRENADAIESKHSNQIREFREKHNAQMKALRQELALAKLKKGKRSNKKKKKGRNPLDVNNIKKQ